MFIDSRSLPRDKNVECDVCIIGAGAAGITLGLEFSKSNSEICLLESGGLNYDQQTQDLYKGQSNIGIPWYSLETARLRYFGGTTNHWHGWGRPCSKGVLEPRSWSPNSGGPLRYEEV